MFNFAWYLIYYDILPLKVYKVCLNQFSVRVKLIIDPIIAVYGEAF